MSARHKSGKRVNVALYILFSVCLGVLFYQSKRADFSFQDSSTGDYLHFPGTFTQRSESAAIDTAKTSSQTLDFAQKAVQQGCLSLLSLHTKLPADDIREKAFAACRSIARLHQQQENLTVLVTVDQGEEGHLLHYASYLESLLQLSGIQACILALQQQGHEPLNRGYLLNVGFLLGANTSDYSVVQDLGYLPFSTVDYTFPRQHSFVHLARQPSKYDFKVPFPRFCSGSLTVKRELFDAVDGYPIQYWGLGPEDDVFCNRLVKQVYGSWPADDKFGTRCPIPRLPEGGGKFWNLETGAPLPDWTYKEDNLKQYAWAKKSLGAGGHVDGRGAIKSMSWQNYIDATQNIGPCTLVKVSLPPSLRPDHQHLGAA